MLITQPALLPTHTEDVDSFKREYCWWVCLEPNAQNGEAHESESKLQKADDDLYALVWIESHAE